MRNVLTYLGYLVLVILAVICFAAIACIPKPTKH